MPAHSAQDNPSSENLLAAQALIDALRDAACFDHPVDEVRMLETHISWILLTGEFAYKIKKPVNFGFLDFSTLSQRHRFCEAELELNRRYAPGIYLDVVAIREDENGPRIGGRGPVLEYAVKMREFPQHCLLSQYAGTQQLTAQIVDAIADLVSEIHASGEPAAIDSAFGSAESVAHWSAENLQHIAQAIPAAYLPTSYFELKRWYRENEQLLQSVAARKDAGYVRDCHGDLHLGNMALLDGRVTAFDCIEFNPELRWIDTISEAAFVAMDLHARGYPGWCWRFLNRYFERGGDYDAIVLLRYYFVYRALVRAKVEALRVDQEECDEATWRKHLQPAIDYIDLASAWAGGHRAGLIIMHGLSGSGKSTVAAQLVERLGAIRIRSDVERKRLFRLDMLQPSDSELDGGIYTAAATASTYRRLAELAATIIAADFTVIVDATLLRQHQRRPFFDLAGEQGCAAVVVDCRAAEAELRRRIVARKGDASEANLEVLAAQIRDAEPVSSDERELAAVIEVDEQGLVSGHVDAIRNRFVS